MTRALITGGAGFVGRALAAGLRARGDEVVVLDLDPKNDPGGIAGSVTDIDDARRAVEGVDVVYHLAGDARLWARDRAVFDRVNAGGVETMIDASRQAGVTRFLLCSSATTLVGRKTPRGPSCVTEDAALPVDDMLGPYPRSKRRAELIVEAACADGFDAVTVNPTEPLGAGDVAMTPPSRMIADFANGATPAYIDCILNFAPVDDLALGFVAAMEKGASGARYILGGENVSMRRLVAAIAENADAPAPKTRLPYAAAFVAGLLDTGLSSLTGKDPKAPLTGVRLAGRQVSFSSEKAARDLGWRAGPFKPALAAAIEDMRARDVLR